MKFLLNKKIAAFIITLQEAFIAVLPFIIFSAFLALISIFTSYFHIRFVSPETVEFFTKTILSFLSVIATVSISFFIAKRIKISEVVAITLSLTVFASIVFYEHPAFPIVLPSGFTIATLFSSIAGTLLLKFFYPKFSLNINLTDGNYHIYRFFNCIFVFFIAYTAAMLIYISLDFVMDILISRYNPLHLNLPKIFILALRDLLVQVFWFFGIHGEHMVNALFGKDILFEHICPNFTYGEFHRLFVNIGGAGIGFSLLIALLINAKDKTLKTLAKISAPFVLFNINDIIIFLIVVFNRFLIMPFLLLPLLNLTLGYMFVNIVHINYTDYYVVWSTPVFVDGFLKTDSFAIPLFQLFLIILDTAVYSFFLKKYFQIQSIENKKQILQENLEINEELKAKKDIKPFLANREMIEANAKLNGLITDLNQDNLLIYYQPKADIRHNKAVKYEALLRYNDNGHIRGPFFLDLIEKAGLAPIIDIWVCKQVKKDIQKFNRQNFFPQISVNLHPDTLTSTDAVNIILNIFENENIMFEIIERSFVNEEAQNNLKKIKAKNFPVSIDDFGVGYSSLETLVKYNIDELKLDKSLIDEIENPKGYLVCKNTIQLCKDLKIKAVAEGVETASQLEIVKNLDVDFVQGYVFSPAIPFEKVKTFSDSFNLTDL